MASVRIDIVRHIDDWQPGFVECHLTDQSGHVWSFQEKVPVVTAEDLDADSRYPRPGLIGCTVLQREGDTVLVGIDPLGDPFECEVPVSDVVEDPV